MKRKPDLNLLRKADSETAKRIAEEYPAEWDMERVFRRSYQKYLSGLPAGNAEKSAVETDSPDMLPQKKPIRMYVSRYATAACLVLTAGVAGLIGYGLFSASKQGITNPAQSSELDIVIETTAPLTEPSQVQVPETVTTAVPAQTAETMITTASAETEAAAAPEQTETVTLTEAEPQNTELLAGQKEETAAAAEPPVQTAAETTETLPAETSAERKQTVKAGFEVSGSEDNTLLKYNYSSDLAPAVYDYSSKDSRFNVSVNFSDSGSDGIAYRITDTEENRSYKFFVYYRTTPVPFQFSVQGYDITEIELGGRTAYRHDLRKQDSAWGCMITWFDGNAVCQISGYKKNADTMLEIAEILQPTT